MAQTPPWLAASSGFAGEAGQINQFLGQHTATWVYAGAQQSAQTTGTGVYQSTQTQYLSQSFTTGVSQTAIGQVWLQLSAVGGSPTSAPINPLTVGVYASSGGAPTGTALGSVTVPEQYVYSAPFWLPIPLIVTGLTPSTLYELQVSIVGTPGHYYAWQQSNQILGAATSPDGVTWTTQAYGLMYQVFDQSVSGRIQFIFEDGGARWTQFTYNAAGQYSTITESTTAQNGVNFYSTRTLAYTNGLLTVVS